MKWLAYLPALVWAGYLLLLGSRTFDLGGADWYPSDKTAHFGLYGLLGVLLAWGWLRTRAPAPAMLIVAGVVLGLADEWHQSFVPGRTADLYDWIVDAIAVTIAFLGVRWVGLRAREKTRS